MSQPARKPGDPLGAKLADSLGVDDPSIPVLTERLTLPPLDLNLEFRRSERPAAIDEDAAVPITEAPAEPIESLEAPETMSPLESSEPGDDSEPGETAAQETAPSEPQPVDDDRAITVMGAQAGVEPPEATGVSPRVPTSLLLSNMDALLAAPPGATLYRERDEFDLTQSDGSRASSIQTDLREMILLELARRLPTEVETIVRRHLENAIDEAIRRFAAEVRIALAGSLREIVDRAVKAELDRLNIRR